MRTLGELNNKVWYRFLKVFYVLIFILCILLCFIFAYTNHETGFKKLDQYDTEIRCNVGTYKAFSPNSLGIYLNKNNFINDVFDYSGYFKGYNEYSIKEILAQCAGKPLSEIEKDDVFMVQRLYEITGVKGSEKQYNKEYLDGEIKNITSGYKTNNEKANLCDFSIKFFDISPVYNYNQFISVFLTGLVIIIVVFEITKRTFYYIIIGNVRPKKN